MVVGPLLFHVQSEGDRSAGRVQADERPVAVVGEGDGFRRSRLQNDRQRACRRLTSTGPIPRWAASTWSTSSRTAIIRIDVGPADTRDAAQRRQVPDAVRQGRVPAARRQELRRRSVPRHVRRATSRASRSIRCPAMSPPRETPETNPEQAKLYSLNIISPKSHGFLNSCYANEPHKIKGQGEQFVMISPADAAKRSIRDGDPVRVYNDRGDFEGVAKRDGRRACRRRRGDARLLALAQPLGRIGQLDLVGRLERPRPCADVLGQSGRGGARQLIERNVRRGSAAAGICPSRPIHD